MKSARVFLRLWPAAVIVALTLVLVGSVEEALAGNRAGKEKTDKRVSRGRYLVTIGGCNDCHTPAFMQGKHDVPEQEWLTGSSVGFMGPWGTSYPWNLRTMVQRMTEAEWVEFVKGYKALPPMPATSLVGMSADDLGAIYTFIKYLGGTGSEAPSGIAPGVAPQTPYVDFSLRLPAAHVGQK